MEFGALKDVSNVDWTFPPEDPSTASFLASLGERDAPKTGFMVGAPVWAAKEWVGKIYPPGMDPSEALTHFSRNFGCIELNPTHYGIPSKAQIEKWTAKVPPGFVFLPKVPKAISHDKNGLLDRKARRAWLDALPYFGSHLGPCFLQLPPTFDYARKAELFHFLESWPDEYDLSLELRHPSWFKDGHVLPALVDYLRGRGMGLVITDVAGRRDVLHSSVSARYSLLRFIGNDLHSSDFSRLGDWMKRLALWQAQGLRTFYFIVHQVDDNVKVPELADVLIGRLNAELGAGVPPLQWISLFKEHFELR